MMEKERAESYDIIIKLPQEIAIEVFKRLNVKDVICCCRVSLSPHFAVFLRNHQTMIILQVSKNWREILYHNAIWNNLCLKIWDGKVCLCFG